MPTEVEIVALSREIRTLQATAQRLSQMGGSIPAIRCNTARILASLKMLELNICDAVDAESVA